MRGPVAGDGVRALIVLSAVCPRDRAARGALPRAGMVRGGTDSGPSEGVALALPPMAHRPTGRRKEHDARGWGCCPELGEAQSYARRDRSSSRCTVPVHGGVEPPVNPAPSVMRVMASFTSSPTLASGGSVAIRLPLTVVRSGSDGAGTVGKQRQRQRSGKIIEVPCAGHGVRQSSPRTARRDCASRQTAVRRIPIAPSVLTYPQLAFFLFSSRRGCDNDRLGLIPPKSRSPAGGGQARTAARYSPTRFR